MRDPGNSAQEMTVFGDDGFIGQLPGAADLRARPRRGTSRGGVDRPRRRRRRHRQVITRQRGSEPLRGELPRGAVCADGWGADSSCAAHDVVASTAAQRSGPARGRPSATRLDSTRSDAPIRHTDVLASVADLVVAASAAAAPLLFVVEDVHWADAATWDLVEYLTRNLIDEPVVVAVTYRTIDASTEPDLRRRIAELTRLPQVSRADLGRLDARRRSHAGSRRWSEARHRRLWFPRSSAAARETHISRRNSSWHARQERIYPRSWRISYATDLDRLDESGRSVVSALAVLGRPADHDLLVAVAEIGDEPDHAIRAAVDAGLVTVEGDTYQVRHALIGEVAYRMLLPGERRRLHRLAAGVLQSGGSRAGQADRVGELAVHLDQAGDISGAFVALLAAADVAEPVAPAAALSHLLRALELWDYDQCQATDTGLIARLWQAADLANGTRGNELAVQLAERALTVGEPPADGRGGMSGSVGTCGQRAASTTAPPSTNAPTNSSSSQVTT